MANRNNVISAASLIVIIVFIIIPQANAQVLPPGGGSPYAGSPLDNYTMTLLAGGLAYGANYIYGMWRKKKKKTD